MPRTSQNGKRRASSAGPKVRRASRNGSAGVDRPVEPVLAPRQWQNRIVGHGEEAADQLLANPRNWRIHPKAQQDALKGVLAQIGWVQDVIVNQRTGFVVDGHARVALAISAGERVPVVYVDLDEQEEAAILATLDPLSAMAGKDDEIFAGLVAGMDEAYRALVTATEVKGFSGSDGLTDPDDAPEPPAVPTTVSGDLWLLGEHRVLCGDCRNFDSIGRLLGAGKANLVVTSPPYASQREYDKSSGFRPIPPDEYVGWYRDVAMNIGSILAGDGSYFLNIKEHCEDGQRLLYVKDLVIAHVREWGWRFVDEFCWKRNSVPRGWENRFKNGWEPVFHFCRQQQIKFRPNTVSEFTDSAFTYAPDNPKSKTGFFSNRGRPDIATPGLARPDNVLEIGAETNLTDAHSAPFPVRLPDFFIRAYTDEGNSVFDPFMGSGSTLMAAEQNNRVGYGCEISPAYCDVIVNRWQNFTGKQATLDGDGRTFDEIRTERTGLVPAGATAGRPALEAIPA